MSNVKSEEITKSKLTHLPTFEEVDEMIKAEFPHVNALCPTLCREYQNAAELLQDVPVKSRGPILVRMRALASEMRTLHCPTCYLE